MDLRIVKTKKVIREAFLELRKNTPLERIKVKDICDIALINKTTFYKHYQDIFALSDELENEAVDTLSDFLLHKGKMYSSPKEFLLELPIELERHDNLLFPLFNDRKDVLFFKIQQRLKSHYIRSDMALDEEIRHTFVIAGAMQVLTEYRQDKRCNQEILADYVSALIEKL